MLAGLAAWTAAMLVGLLLWAPAGATRAALLACIGLLLAVFALGALACAAMVYVSQRSVLAWRHPLVVPVHMLVGLVTGLALMYVLMTPCSRPGPGDDGDHPGRLGARCWH